MQSEAAVNLMRDIAHVILQHRDTQSGDAIELAVRFLALDAAIQKSSDNIPRSWVPF